MTWACLVLLVTMPALTFADAIPEATRAHLKLLEERLVAMPAGRARDKVSEEISRIRREYGLNRPRAGVSSSAGAYQQTDNWERQKKDFHSAAEEELKRRQEYWQRAKEDFAKAAEEELKRRREGPARYYSGRAEWRQAYESNLAFAQKTVRLGGLGYEFAEAQTWVTQMMERRPPANIAAFRARYAKAVKFAQLPKEESGLGHVRGYARKVAMEIAEDPSESAVDNWIAANRRPSFRAAREPAGTCHSWYKIFSK